MSDYIEYTVKVHPNGDKFWYVNDKLHREDGPAIELLNGDKYWYLNHQLHREDGPAIEYYDGSKKWYVNGKLHREDGPAIDNFRGIKSWWLNGKNYSEKDFHKEMNKSKSCTGKTVEIDGKKYKLIEI